MSHIALTSMNLSLLSANPSPLEILRHPTAKEQRAIAAACRPLAFTRQFPVVLATNSAYGRADITAGHLSAAIFGFKQCSLRSRIKRMPCPFGTGMSALPRTG